MKDSEAHKVSDGDDREALEAQIKKLKRERTRSGDAQALLARSQEAERRFTEQVSALVEIATELAMTESMDELCRRAVELGQSRLGFDRLGLWFRGDEPDVVVGSFGVDRHGHLCDERGIRTRVNPEDPDGRVLLSREPFVLVGEGPVVDSLGETVGHGSQIFAALWDGERVIGHVSADNQVRYRPLLRQQCELLRLFGTTVGSLCTQKRIKAEREKLIEELQDALAKIKTLRGLLPICSNCKKIRDDKGYWQAIEVYIHDHSDADFSHSLCPECARKLYPELADEEEGEPAP
ncbi:MAG: GAF domain-containing protein [Candidatus Hydrogenedentes bacterium]|nr:GAF domain-containing protein [Candidatus Hydrogenedentota bacterium]